LTKKIVHAIVTSPAENQSTGAAFEKAFEWLKMIDAQPLIYDSIRQVRCAAF
jgi:hypothetical protein